MADIKEVKIGDRFKYTPQVDHSPNEEKEVRVVRIYQHPRYGDTRYEVIDEGTGERRRDYLLLNFQAPSITVIKEVE